MCLKKNQNAPRPSEHPPVMGMCSLEMQMMSLFPSNICTTTRLLLQHYWRIYVVRNFGFLLDGVFLLLSRHCDHTGWILTSTNYCIIIYIWLFCTGA